MSSVLKPLCIETSISNIATENGKAAITETDCTAARPPVINNITEVNPIQSPQMTLIGIVGVKLPFDISIPI